MPKKPSRVLITGVNGLVGNIIYRHLSSQDKVYDVYGLDRSEQPSKRIFKDFTTVTKAKFIQADLSNFEETLAAMDGIDTVLHLAADPDGLSWESVLGNNLVGTYNVFEASRQQSVKRVIFASSVMVNFGYREDETYGPILHNPTLPELPDQPRKINLEDHFPFPILTHKDPTRPSGLYPASKVWGEALAYAYHFRYGISYICVRIGWVVGENRPREKYKGAVWCSHRDCAQLFQRCIEAPQDVAYDIFYAVSDNRYRFVDLDHARAVLGYVPMDSDTYFTENQLETHS